MKYATSWIKEVRDKDMDILGNQVQKHLDAMASNNWELVNMVSLSKDSAFRGGAGSTTDLMFVWKQHTQISSS